MRLSDFKVLTFDCYGTLIDWETGLLVALQPLLARVEGAIPRDQALAEFARHESRQQAETPGMRYPELLARVHGQLAAAWGVAPDTAESRRFGLSVPDWPAFPDTAGALRDLKQHYKLVILSNVDRESFQGSARRLGVAFDAVCTAEDIGSYKPDPRNFEYLLGQVGEIGFGKADILHTAQSLFHDHVPAAAFGLASAWIDRRGEAAAGWGATMPPQVPVTPAFRFGSLGEMAAAREEEHG